MTQLAGTWDVTVATPLGAQSFLVDLAVDGAALSGNATRDGNEIAIAGGTVDGDTGTFDVALTEPMKITLGFTVTASGDALTGKAKAGFMPAFDVTGTRHA